MQIPLASSLSPSTHRGGPCEVTCICFEHPTAEVCESRHKRSEGRGPGEEPHYSWESEMMNKSSKQSGERVPFDKCESSPHDLF